MVPFLSHAVTKNMVAGDGHFVIVNFFALSPVWKRAEKEPDSSHNRASPDTKKRRRNPAN